MADNRVSDSKMAMWRSLIALAYADNTLSNPEKAMLLDYIKANHISGPQYEELKTDIDNSVQLKEVYPAITDVRDRAHLLNMARILFYSDGDFSVAEKKAYDAIHHDQEVAVDFHKVEEHANQFSKDYESQLEKDEQNEFAKEGILERIMDYLSFIPKTYS